MGAHSRLGKAYPVFIPGRAEGANPESSSQQPGFRVRRFAAPRNDRERNMTISRRHFVLLAAASALSVPARAAPMSALGLDAAQFGLRPGHPDDQSRTLQRAIEEAAHANAPLALAPGVYRVGNIKLPTGAQLVGVRGATRVAFTEGSSLLVAENAERITLTGLTLDGLQQRLPQRRGLVHLENTRSIRISDCEIVNAGGNALHCIAVDGQVSDTTIADSLDAAIHSLDARGLLIARNTIAGAGDNGIQVWRSQAGDDGTMVTDNRITRIANRSGGSGQYGNAINVFRSGNVIVRGNRIDNCAFSAVRGNAAANLHIEGNAITNAREVALYSEFGFEGALIANNSVDGAALGIVVTNFNQGGRLAAIQGNIIRNLFPRRPDGTDPNDGAGIGIAAEADAAITGNVIEHAPFAGLVLGFGQYLRDVAATGNVVRRADIGIAVSVSRGAGHALIANNVIAEVTRGAIIGMDRRRIVSGDLMKDGGERYANLSISGNRVR
jgi:uncharacterized secreted repeat protein (TIGR03808 family)